MTTKMLDEFVFSLTRNAGITKATVTIELERKYAERFIFNLASDLHQVMLTNHMPMSEIKIGTVFKYRGVNFRVVEIVDGER